MKKIILLLFLLPFIMFSQTKPEKKDIVKKEIEQINTEDTTKETILKNEDFVTENNIVRNNRQTFYLNDGSDKPIKTQFFFSATDEKFKTLGLDNINMINHISNFKTVLQMKNKYTYQPRKVSLMYSADLNKWIYAIEYTAQNDYGALKNGTVFFTYDNNGKEIESWEGH